MDAGAAAPIIISSWFQWLAGVILSGASAAIVYLFHNKADRAEYQLAVKSLEALLIETRTDVREVRAALMAKAINDLRK